MLVAESDISSGTWYSSSELRLSSREYRMSSPLSSSLLVVCRSPVSNKAAQTARQSLRPTNCSWLALCSADPPQPEAAFRKTARTSSSSGCRSRSCSAVGISDSGMWEPTLMGCAPESSVSAAETRPSE